MNEHLKTEFKISSNEVLSGIRKAVEKANTIKKDILFSYTFRFNTLDLLPIITHPSDRDNFRFFWEKPSEGLSLVGLGSVWSIDYKRNITYHNFINKINSLFTNSVSISDFPSIGPKLIGGHAFNMHANADKTWKGFPRSLFYLPECQFYKKLKML